MMRLSLGYPDRAGELAILEDNPAETILQNLRPLLTARDFLAMQQDCSALFCHPSLKEAVADIVRATREHPAVSLGASPRAGLQLLAAARALALVRRRDYVTDDDIKALAVPVLSHRLKLRSDTRTAGDAAALISEIVERFAIG
jgi:MoxR-like ATPase